MQAVIVSKVLRWSLFMLKSIFKFLFKSIPMAVITLLFVGSLLINATMLAWNAGALAISNMFAAATGISSVIGGLHDINQGLKGKNAKLTARNKTLKTKLAGSSKVDKKAASKIAKRISRRTAVAASRNLAAIPAESVPVYGIAVIVAATVWELTEACETMKDMQALNIALGNEERIDADAAEVCGLQLPTEDEVMESIKSSSDGAWKKIKDWSSDTYNYFGEKVENSSAIYCPGLGTSMTSLPSLVNDDGCLATATMRPPRYAPSDLTASA